MKLALAALFLLANFSLADDTANAKLLKDLQGAYKLVAVERGGAAPEKEFSESIDRVVINGDSLTVKFKNKKENEEKTARILVDASQKPAHIDLKVGAENASTGILLLDGDMLKFCWIDGKGARPTEFKTMKGDRYMLMTLKRVKE